MIDDNSKADLKKIAENSAKLLYEVQRLHRDVQIVKGRIEPFEDGNTPVSIDPPKAKWRLAEALNLIAESRQTIEGIERDVQNIRSMMQNITSDAISRSEMKPWLRRD